MATRTYSIDQVALAWKNIDFSEGLATGSSITESHSGPGTTVTSSAVGNAISTYDPNLTGTLTVLVDQTSDLHRKLIGVWNAYKNPDTRSSQFGTAVMRDASSSFTANYLAFHTLKEPEEVRGTEAAVFSWTFGYEKREKSYTDANSNVVG